MNIAGLVFSTGSYVADSIRRTLCIRMVPPERGDEPIPQVFFELVEGVHVTVEASDWSEWLAYFTECHVRIETGQSVRNAPYTWFEEPSFLAFMKATAHVRYDIWGETLRFRWMAYDNEDEWRSMPVSEMREMMNVLRDADAEIQKRYGAWKRSQMTDEQKAVEDGTCGGGKEG